MVTRKEIPNGKQGLGTAPTIGAIRVASRLTDQVTRPTMLKAGFIPQEEYPGSKEPWRCVCERCGKESTPSYKNIRSGASGGCGYCAGIRIDPQDAVAIMRTSGLEPLTAYVKASVPWSSKCMACGTIGSPRYNDVQQGGGGCVPCSNQSRSEKQRLDSKIPIATMRDARLEPFEPYVNARTPWSCQCLVCDHLVAPAYDNVRKRGRGCTYCAGKTVDLAEARKVMEAAGLKPLTPYPGSGMPWVCVCLTCLNEVSPRYDNVSIRGQGCIHCQGGVVDPIEARKVMEAAGLKPLTEYPGSKAPWPCICLTCDNEVSPQYGNVAHRGAGCIHCSTSGFNPAEPAFVYLIQHDTLDAWKIGKANYNTGRLPKHYRNGWRFAKIWEFEVGGEASRLEKAILGWWREELELPYAATPEDMPQGGYTETANRTLVSLIEIKTLAQSCLTFRNSSVINSP